MDKYACIGWGSLIWDPRSLPTRSEWHSNGPRLGIEFQRQSKGDRLTLVLSPNARLVQTLWVTLEVDSLSEAVAVLRQREGVPIGLIGCWPGASTSAVDQVIAAWATEQGLDGAVWTASPPKWNNKTGSAPTEEEAIAWLSDLGERQGPAREYIEKAPASVRTPYRDAFERYLGWLPKGPA